MFLIWRITHIVIGFHPVQMGRTAFTTHAPEIAAGENILFCGMLDHLFKGIEIILVVAAGFFAERIAMKIAWKSEFLRIIGFPSFLATAKCSFM